MGLDTVELVILIEKELGISFVDSEFEKVKDVEDVCNYVYLLQKENSKKNSN